MTKGYLLDTNIISHLIRALNNETSAQCTNVLKHYQCHEKDARIFICAATTGEIEYGLNISTTPDPVVQQQVREILDIFPEVLKIDKHIAAEQYAILRANIFNKYAPKNKRGRAKTRYLEEWCDPTTGKTMGINENDIWIASVALAYNLHLVTDDGMDRIVSVAPAGFSVLNWTVP